MHMHRETETLRQTETGCSASETHSSSFRAVELTGTMKNRFALPSCLLLLWTFTVFVSCAEKVPDSIITVTELAEGIKVTCPDGHTFKKHNDTVELKRQTKDEYTGEYTCTKTDDTSKYVTIFVKFRSCDNCVELDIMSTVGMVIGNVVATIVIGVGVYLLASQTRTGPVVSNRKSKSSDRQHLVTESRGPSNDHYQPLRRAGQRDTYDELVHRK
ncbi:T-cell surface glycoprotein CD3 delta chain-like isoform X1 [Oreochromis aureus]|uniref:T-cell surface glycoprotein CD3 delta chain-like isoform X1 n=1 Tax=Oreochromis aureus TaxID=47969 RepID=UPI0019539D15|nr:T-cell surface glycoprotein CD3 delta chain-like isoform X1 [Oreochromis aureus]